MAKHLPRTSASDLHPEVPLETHPPPYTPPRCIRCRGLCPCSQPQPMSRSATRYNATASPVSRGREPRDSLTLPSDARGPLEFLYKAWFESWVEDPVKFERKHRDKGWYPEWYEWMQARAQHDARERVTVLRKLAYKSMRGFVVIVENT